MTTPSAAGEGQREITLILDEVFLSLFSSILEQSTNINHVNRRIKALFATCTAEVFGYVFELDPVGSAVYIIFLQAVANFSQKMVIRYQQSPSLIQQMRGS